MKYRDPRLHGIVGTIGLPIIGYACGHFGHQGDWMSAGVMAMFAAIIMIELIRSFWNMPPA
jgi:hypothetical protein